MIVIECEQGSPEWHAARVGVITGSEFITARGIYKSGKDTGKPNAAAKAYAFKKAIERIGGKLLDDGFENWGMRRGHEMEPAARAEHEIQLGEVVHRCGFVKTDCGRYGSSLDGMIGNVGGSEYKAFASPEKLRDILIEGDLSEVIDQVQGGIWVAELEWMDFCLYCPELASAGNTLWHRRIYRDDKHIAELVRDLKRFDLLVCDYMDAIRKSMQPAEEMACRADGEQEAARIADQQRQQADAERQAADALAVAAAPPPAPTLAQDECRPLSVALATKPDAPMHAREAAEHILAARLPDKPVDDGPATLNLTAINARFGGRIKLDAAGLALMGIEHSATEKSARLYRESDIGRICRALVVLCAEVQELQAA